MDKKANNEKIKYLKTLGAHIKKVRVKSGYSQDRVCLEGDLSRATISRIEAGKVDAQIWTLARIANIIGVPLRKLTDVNLEEI